MRWDGSTYGLFCESDLTPRKLYTASKVSMSHMSIHDIVLHREIRCDNN